MNLALNKNEPPSYSMRIFVSMWRILKAVVYIVSALLLMVVLMPIGQAIMKSGDPTGWLFFTAVFLSLISIIILAYSIKNDRFASVVISLSLLAFILISIFAVNLNEIRYTATALLAFTVTAFLVFQRLPLFAFVVAMGTLILSMIHYALVFDGNSGFISRNGYASAAYTIFLQSILQFLMNPLLLLIFALLLIACAYIPRMVTWSDWVWPAFQIRKHAIRKNSEQGFTLIELLIVIAIISILFGGTFSVWSNNIVLHKQLIDRTRIETMLQSEMAALSVMDTLPAPSDEQNPLPVALQEFGVQRMNGYYTVSQTEVGGLVEIAVHLVQYPGVPSETHYRLVAQRRTGEATP
ncbi:prepilin-type N-terminal cleavage/methylation domain-containing protein [bacterium]|nr:prepilin-type N-terminal cleavage/methylation domain-containing protein [bacterium]